MVQSMINKIAVIYSSEKSEWQSCQSIVKNLCQSYSHLGESSDNEIQFYNVSKSDPLMSASQCALEVFNWNPSRIVWLDYKPTPLQFLRAYFSICNKQQAEFPELWIHIYGDFVLNICDWGKMLEILKAFPLKLLCASVKQKELVVKFFEFEGDLVEVCPFPIDTNLFNYKKEVRNDFKNRFNICSDETLFLYSGRLSFQKNIFHMLYAFRDYLQMSSGRARLILAGPVDDLGMPYLGISGPLNAFYGQFMRVKANMQDLFDQDRVILLGDLGQKDLSELYSSCDALINLSTHNDEDYGMAVAESLSSGMPTLITAWGGFCGFKQMIKNGVTLFPVKREKGRYLPSYGDVLKGLISFNRYSDENRIALAQEAKVAIGINSISQLLKTFKSGKLLGVTDDMRRVQAIFESVSKGPFKGPKGELSELYYHIYGGYGEVISDK